MFPKATKQQNSNAKLYKYLSKLYQIKKLKCNVKAY